MDKNSVKSNNDSQIRWWWPGHWLRIVYSVWFDQLWYWENIRPCLSEKYASYKLLISGMFGSLIVGSFLGLLINILISQLGYKVTGWHLLIMSIFIIVIAIFSVAILLVALTSQAQIAKATSWCLGSSVVLTTVSGSLLTLLLSDIPVIILFLVFSLAIGLSISFGEGIGSGVKASLVRNSLLPVVFILFFVLLSRFTIGYGLLLGLAYFLGVYLGGFWSTRQLQSIELC